MSSAPRWPCATAITILPLPLGERLALGVGAEAGFSAKPGRKKIPEELECRKRALPAAAGYLLLRREPNKAARPNPSNGRVDGRGTTFALAGATPALRPPKTTQPTANDNKTNFFTTALLSRQELLTCFGGSTDPAPLSPAPATAESMEAGLVVLRARERHRNSGPRGSPSRTPIPKELPFSCQAPLFSQASKLQRRTLDRSAWSVPPCKAMRLLDFLRRTGTGDAGDVCYPDTHIPWGSDMGCLNVPWYSWSGRHLTP